MEIYTNQIKEWTDYENQYKIAVAAVKWLDKHLKIIHGKRERNLEHERRRKKQRRLGFTVQGNST